MRIPGLPSVLSLNILVLAGCGSPPSPNLPPTATNPSAHVSWTFTPWEGPAEQGEILVP